MSEKLYVKQGRRYVPVGSSHIGFPAPGVWIVTEGKGMRSERLFTQLGEPLPIMTYAAFERHREVIAATINRVGKNLHTLDQMAGEIIKAVCLAEEAEKDGRG
jgi:hypothetical protein